MCLCLQYIHNNSNNNNNNNKSIGMKRLISCEMFFAIVTLLTLNGFFIANTSQFTDDENLSVGYYIESQQNETMSYAQDRDMPKFGESMHNMTIPVGREAILACVVDNLQTYKIAWLRVDTQTILTIQSHVITKNHRMSIAHVEKRAWVLKIKDVKESDRGWYMCQINTDPMKSQTVFLNVVVPPDILDYPTSTDMVVREGSNVTLRCAASGSPEPVITWRRENGDPIALSNDVEVTSINSSTFTISRVNRLHMGAYLCIASNGIPPTISKRVMLIVHFPPMIAIQNQLVGAAFGQRVTLECHSEAYPKSINYWMKNETIITPGGRFEPSSYEKDYKVVMKLTIKPVDENDFGNFKCIAKNSLGDTDGSIKLYHLPQSTIVTTMSTTTAMDLLTTNVIQQQLNDNFVDRNLHNTNKSPWNMSNASSNNNLFGATSGLWNPLDGSSGIRDRDHRTNDRKRNKQNGGGGGKNKDRDLSRDNEILNAAVTFSQLSTTCCTKTQLILVTIIVKLMTNIFLFQSIPSCYNDAVIV